MFLVPCFCLATPYRVYPPVTQKLARLWTQYCEAIMKVRKLITSLNHFLLTVLVDICNFKTSQVFKENARNLDLEVN